MALACRHVELDGIGKGKRVLRPPGGTSSNIFGPEPVTNGSSSPGTKDHQRSQVFDDETDSGQVTPTRTSPRKSLDDSQNRLFGSPESNSSPRKLTPVDSRNPITGLTKTQEPNGTPHHNGINGANPVTGNGIETDQKNTSVKMHNPPGGRSQLQFF